MCEGTNNCFTALSIIVYISVFTCSLINMIFAGVNSGGETLFKPLKLKNYNEEIEEEFLSKIETNTTFDFPDTIGTTGIVVDLCYDGKCKYGDSSITSKNCSLACIEKETKCFLNDGNVCPTQPKCEKVSGSKDSACERFNEIYFWRSMKFQKTYTKYRFNLVEDTKTKKEQCQNGYHQCGYLNENGDKLCFQNEIPCPINEIIVQKDIIEDPDYKKCELNEKSLYYTNKSAQGVFIQDIVADTSYKKYYSEYPSIDQDTLYNFLLYNKYLYSGAKISTEGRAYLRIKKYSIKVEEIRTNQKIYDSHKDDIINENIDEITKEIDQYGTIIQGFGIAAFASFAGTGFYFIALWSNSNCGKNCGRSCKECGDCSCCENLTVNKILCIFYAVFFPQILFSILSFIFVIGNEAIFDKYRNMKNIRDYVFCEEWFGTVCYFDDKLFYNKGQFILLLIIVIIIIIYPICTFVISLYDRYYSGIKAYTSAQINEIKGPVYSKKKSTPKVSVQAPPLIVQMEPQGTPLYQVQYPQYQNQYQVQAPIYQPPVQYNNTSQVPTIHYGYNAYAAPSINQS